MESVRNVIREIDRQTGVVGVRGGGGGGGEEGIESWYAALEAGHLNH